MDGAQGVAGDGVDGLVEADADVALCPEVVDLVGLDAAKDLAEADAVGQIAVVQENLGCRIVGVSV